MKKLLLIVAVLCTGVIAYMAFGLRTAVNPDPNHTHADFAVWINGEQLDFSSEELMSGLSTDPNHDNEEGNRKYLHLHDGVGHVIHRHKPGLTLSDFFGTLQVGLDGDCYTSSEPLADGQICDDGHPWRMFVNGTERPFDLSYAFTDEDHILLTTSADAEQIEKELGQLTDDACTYSKTCPWKGAPPAEGCIADPMIPCVVD